MSKPFIVPLPAQFMAATAGRNMTGPAYAAVGVLTMVLLTVNPAYEAAHHLVQSLLWACLAFFGEMALLGNNVRGANVATTKVSRLLVPDLADFRLLTARHPDLVQTIDAEARRRELEN